MCVAIYVPKGIQTPSLETLALCWESNPHGAGFAMRKQNKSGKSKFELELHKGFMTFEEFANAYNKYGLADFNEDLFLHFRITTHGGTSKGNCHPFPLVEDTKLLKCQNTWTNYAVIHNGILPIQPSEKDISDTMEFVKQMYKNKKYKDIDKFFQGIEGAVGGNKIAIMTPDDVKMLGNWKVINGVYYSNDYWNYTASYLQSFRPSSLKEMDCTGQQWELDGKDLKSMNEGKCPYCDADLSFFWKEQQAYCDECGFGCSYKENENYDIVSGVGEFYF